MKRIVTFFLLGTITLGFLSGCVRKDGNQNASNGKVELVYYKLFDDEDVMKPLIQKYETKHPNVTITYRKFQDPVEYQNLILNELAEGQGPDIFSVPNSWFLRNLKKITPASPDALPPTQFEQTFASVAAQDLVYNDPNDGKRKVFGIPLSIDTLGLYYNRSAFEDAIPSRGRPAATWEELKDDVYKLSKQDNSLERFQVAGIAMGRSDNIARATDILYMLMLQLKTTFYDQNYTHAIFAGQQITTAGGQFINPASEALDLYTSFALPTNKNYSWNNYLANTNSDLKEMETFARGKVAMIFGYPYLYEQIKAEIQDLKSKGIHTIDPNDIRVSAVPQMNDPSISSEKRVTYANYYAETVARTSPHADIAWDFLNFLSSKDNIQSYSEKTHHPTSRRDLIEDQKRDTIYGAFADQIGSAESLPMYDQSSIDDIFRKAIDAVIATVAVNDAVKIAEGKVNALLSEQSFLPTPAPQPKTTGKVPVKRS